MHECPNCCQACDCTGDDTWSDAESEICTCDCEWAADNYEGFSDSTWDDDDHEQDWPEDATRCDACGRDL